MREGFDTKCLDLAEYFLNPGAPREMAYDLAQHIQNAIESWLYDEMICGETENHK